MDIRTLPSHICARILVVDDHPSVALSLARAVSLLGQGIETIVANNGEEALELVKDKPVDILITDMMMPGINGIQLIEKLQSNPGGQPNYIIMITAYEIADLKMSAQRLKVNDVLLKPVRPERICRIVAAAIENLSSTRLANLAGC